MIDPEVISVGSSKATLYRSAPSWGELKTAAVGSIKFKSFAEGNVLLLQIIAKCKDEGYEALLGPLDGDTWHSYRLVYESDGSPPFLMEPSSKEHDLAVFTQSGFEPISKYISAKAKLVDTLGEKPVEISGIQVLPWDGKNGEELIRGLFDMSEQAFSKNNFFTPITFKGFMAIYEPLLPMIQKEHVLFARDEKNVLMGFLFGMPDFMDHSGTPSAILKTYASRMRGVGHLLADTYHRRAIDMGFETVIHALIHEDNISKEHSEKHKAKTIRKYALMGRKL